MSKRVVLIDGARTPFLRSGTDYMDLMSYQLGAFAIKGVLDKTGIKPDQVDQVVMGTVVHNVKTPNVAREAALTAGLAMNTPCQTVSQACISANQAISRGADLIRLGHADLITLSVGCSLVRSITFKQLKLSLSSFKITFTLWMKSRLDSAERTSP